MSKSKKEDALRQETREIVRAAGGVTVLSRELDVTRQAIYCWRRIPVRHARKVARLSNRSLRSIRPDVYAAANGE